MAQLTELIEVCQTCLQCSCEEAEFHKLNNSDPELEDVRLRDKLYFCVPELKDVSSCLKIMQFFNFVIHFFC